MELTLWDSFVSETVLTFLSLGTALSLLRLTTGGNERVISRGASPAVRALLTELSTRTRRRIEEDMYMTLWEQALLCSIMDAITDTPTDHTNADYRRWLSVNMSDVRKAPVTTEAVERVRRIELPRTIEHYNRLEEAYVELNQTGDNKMVGRKLTKVRTARRVDAEQLRCLLKASYFRRHPEWIWRMVREHGFFERAIGF